MAGVISFAKYLKSMKQALLFLLVLVSLTACKRKEKKGEDKLYLQYTQYNEIVKKYGVATTDSIPANSAVVAVSAMRLRSVDFDIFFLSLVRIRNFLNLARESFDSLIPFP